MEDKSIGEQMAETVMKLKSQFDALKAEKESAMSPEQKKEYEKLVESTGMNNAIAEFDTQLEKIKSMAADMSKPK